MPGSKNPLVAELLARPWQAKVLAEPIPIDQLPTPALVIDEAAFERNVAQMQSFLAARGKLPRPHGKTHKCPLVAKRQLDAGATGVCVAKVSEALVMVHAGVDDVLVTSPIASSDKAAIVADLAGRSQIKIVVDNLANLALLDDALAAAGHSMTVLVDVDVSMGRTGVRGEDGVMALIAAIDASPQLAFGGIQHYAGHLMHVADFSERAEASRAGWDVVQGLLDSLAGAGLTCPIVTGAGTGTYDIDINIDCLTDLQVGSYIFMDAEYLAVGSEGSDRFEGFDVSLTVQSRAISQPSGRAITLDCGYKGMASDTIPPLIENLPDCRFRFGGDEHGIVLLPEGAQEPLMGQVVSLITSHCDPTVNLYDFYWVSRDGLARELWPITCRGCSW